MFQRLLAAGITALLLASCAQSPSMGETEIRQGRISRIDAVSLEGSHQLGLGAIIGGIAGGVLGHQIGGGTGQTVATIAGALAGGAAGQGVQNRYGERRPGQHIMGFKVNAEPGDATVKRISRLISESPATRSSRSPAQSQIRASRDCRESCR